MTTTIPPTGPAPALADQVLAIPNPFGGSSVSGWIVDGITKAINAFFGDLVKDALNPLLKLLGRTLLTTPDPTSLPRVGQMWENSREIAVACYALLILAAGILVMGYQTLQTRHSVKEIAPRIVVGFITANMSLLLAGHAVAFANALSTSLLSGGVDPQVAATTLTALVMNAVTNGGIFLTFIGLAVAGILISLLVCYVIRVALTVILIAGAPLALMCHALPQTEGIARWWWRAFAGVLAIQLAQSLTLVAALNVFIAPGGFSFFGPTAGGLADLIVTIALLYILFKIPFWILHAIQVGGGRSFIGGAVKGVIAYKTLGLLGLRGGGAGSSGGAGGRRPGTGGSGPGQSGSPRGPQNPQNPPSPRRGGPGGFPAGGTGRTTRPTRSPSGPPRSGSDLTGGGSEGQQDRTAGRSPRMATAPRITGTTANRALPTRPAGGGPAPDLAASTATGTASRPTPVPPARPALALPAPSVHRPQHPSSRRAVPVPPPPTGSVPVRLPIDLPATSARQGRPGTSRAPARSAGPAASAPPRLAPPTPASPLASAVVRPAGTSSRPTAQPFTRPAPVSRPIQAATAPGPTLPVPSSRRKPR
ncbi:hypothetical protein [Jatrophihabitans lederbergiae]|uniref:Type IV secretion system protein n=1 Tax=Jatrophihabitans lederbergiae TaxID=3075547 RepID=A0ABU2JGJ3_9ACTN|nr:hypothetical protein [Jatrophihabitans sp. DSM 44399]MDT0264121.1 hypothetical protein [Jatrophihabitans sp. DSM 44399]